MSATGSPFFLWGLVSALGVLIALLLHGRRRRRVAEAFGDPELAARLLGDDLRRRPSVRIALVGCSAALVAAALADPRWSEGAPEGALEVARGGPVVLVLDASSSMLAKDVEPDRLEQERAAARAIAGALRGVPVGIVAFAGRAYAMAPPTTDAGAIELYLSALHPGMVTQSGSSMAAAVRQGLALVLSSDDALAGSVVLITDGDTDEEPEALAAAVTLAARTGVPVHSLGAGTHAGGAVPLHDFRTGRVTGVMTAGNGSAVVSRLDDGFLREIASRTGAMYHDLAEPRAAERVAAAVRDRSVRAGSAGGADRNGGEWHGLLTGLALLLLSLETIGPRITGAVRRSGRYAPGAAALLLAAATAGCGQSDPARHFEAGRFAEARAEYRQRLAAAPHSAILHYDLGATMLRLEEHDGARPYLETAARTGDPRTRQWAYYNTGNSWLEPVVADAIAGRAEMLTDAIAGYKQALLLDAGDRDAKWNLELARRLLDEEPRSPRRPPDPSSGHGGAGGGDGGGGEDAAGGAAPERGDSGAGAPRMTSGEAERLLDAAQGREIGVQRDALRKRQPPRTSH